MMRRMTSMMAERRTTTSMMAERRKRRMTRRSFNAEMGRNEKDLGWT
jgi:hypothetical protein